MATPQNRIIWIALVASLVVYVVIAFVADVPPNPNAPVAILLPVLVFLSIGVAAGTLLFRRSALAGPIQSGKLDPTTPEGAARALPVFMVNLVLSESVGIYGLVLSFLSGDPLFTLAFSGAALVLLFLHRPTAPDLAPPQRGDQRATDSTPIA